MNRRGDRVHRKAAPGNWEAPLQERKPAGPHPSPRAPGHREHSKSSELSELFRGNRNLYDVAITQRWAFEPVPASPF